MEDLIERIHGLNEFAQIFLLTISGFISEDLTIIIATTAYLTETISQRAFYLGLYFGIILSDTLIYLIGKTIGHNRKKLLFMDIMALRKKAEKYEKQGFVFFVITRFTPGLRAPSMFAAGLANYSLKKFILAKSLSVIILLVIIEMFGTLLTSFISENKIILAGFFISLSFLLIFSYKIYKGDGFRPFYYRIVKYRYFEFWHPVIFYIPAFIYYIYKGVKNLDLLLPIYANPAIRYGGFIAEKKSEIQNLFSPQANHYLKTLYLEKESEPQKKLKKLKSFLEKKNLSYPIILKPDSGQRGNGVKLVKNNAEAKKYLSQANFDIIAQQYCNYQKEAGVFFYYDVKTNKPKIYSLTIKDVPQIIGDGKNTFKELILQDKRAKYMASTYLKRFENIKDKILKNGEKFNLVVARNHAQGCIFKNGTNLIDDKLVKVFDNVSKKIDGFYIGRFDIKYKDIEDLKLGKNFKIIELNGSGAEATHIYDKDVNLITAYKTLFKQWDLVFERASFCKKNKLYEYNFKKFVKEYFAYLKTAKSYEVSS